MRHQTRIQKVHPEIRILFLPVLLSPLPLFQIQLSPAQQFLSLQALSQFLPARQLPHHQNLYPLR